MSVWRPIPDFDYYEASADGRVRSWKNNRWGMAARPRVLSRNLNKSNGYFYTRVDGINQPVHALVTSAFHGPRPEGQEVRHRNGDRTDNRASNLEWGTRSENAYDCIDHGTNPRSARTRCPKGHEYDEDNTMHCRRGDGRAFRACRACRREAYYSKRTAVA